jgi:hypothetical protein
MRVTRMVWYVGTALTALGMLAASATAAAQEQGRASHARSSSRAAADSSAARRRAANVKGFRGVAAKLNTTPEALENAYEHDRQANPKLSRGNFIAANVLADNLGQQHPNITTPAILSGLQQGENVGQTLQNLGLSASEAKQARQAADCETDDAEKSVKEADKRDQKDAEKRDQAQRDAKQKARREANDERKRENQ